MHGEHTLEDLASVIERALAGQASQGGTLRG